MNSERKARLKEIAKKSIIEEIIKKESALREKEIKEHKKKSLFYSTIITLFFWLCIGLIIRNLLVSAGISIIIGIIALLLIIYSPIKKQKNYSKKVESDLPDFLTKVIYEMRAGKSFLRAIKDASIEEGFSAKEFQKVVNEIEKGSSLAEALERMNQRITSISIRRANSNLYNIWLHGTNDIEGLKRLTQELFLKQRIESKEFSSKMIVYALVFIAISAIVPAMFQSFIIIGSYFMKITLNPIQVFIIITGLFPLIDVSILALINSKTPLFLKQI